MSDPLRLHDKVIAIIGGTGGLGASAARACCAAGARVVALGRDPAKGKALAEELGDGFQFVAGDAADPAAAPAAIAEAVRRWGRLDGLYHVAGGSGRKYGDGPLHAIPDDGWRHTLDWNLTSVFYSNRAALAQMLEQGDGGSIVNLTSVLAARPAPEFFATHAYAAAKAAIVGLTTSAAAYYAPHNIRVNALAPALVETPMAARATSDAAIRQYVERRQPLAGGRVGQAQDLNGAVVFLFSDEARYLTGQVLAVDGGWSVM